MQPNSSHEPHWIASLARRIGLAKAQGRAVWCIFDNAAGNAASVNALALTCELDRQTQ